MVRGQDVDCCDLGSWQQDLLSPELALIGHAIAGQMVTMLTSITVIINATVALISGIDVANRVLVGSIFRSPKDYRSKRVGHTGSDPVAGFPGPSRFVAVSALPESFRSN